VDLGWAQRSLCGFGVENEPWHIRYMCARYIISLIRQDV